MKNEAVNYNRSQCGTEMLGTNWDFFVRMLQIVFTI